MRTVDIAPTFEAWQAAARKLLRTGVPPPEVIWREAAEAAAAEGTASPGSVRVPREFIDLARDAASHHDPARWQLLYEVLWRLVHERQDLLRVPTDPQVRRLRALAEAARRPADRGEAEEALSLETEGAGAAPFVPAGGSLAELGEAVRRCTGCDLYRNATQAVFGRGAADARVMLVGEQPGEQEDLRGAPFVGPAGDVLDRALAELGLDRSRLYVTNVVKHFKFVLRGRRRIHQTPRLSEVTACRPWLEAELRVIRPDTLVCLGATAAHALLGPDFRLLRQHGQVFPTPWAPRTLATIHPSAVLRGDDEAAQARLYRMLVDDLRLAIA